MLASDSLSWYTVFKLSKVVRNGQGLSEFFHAFKYAGLKYCSLTIFKTKLSIITFSKRNYIYIFWQDRFATMYTQGQK